jgi:hypothetical protein
MAYSRSTATEKLATGKELGAAMAGIGMRFATRAAKDPNIEDTLIASSIEGMLHDDLRVLSVLTTWLGVHCAWINADRLSRGIEEHPDPRVLAFWAAQGQRFAKDRRFARLLKLYNAEQIDVLRTGTDFQIKRRGKDQRFADGPLRVPEGVLRDRANDVLSPSELAKRHHTYRCRVQLGPTYRADMWAEIERDPKLTATEIARRTYGSFATAWQVKKDWQVLHDQAAD